ncbi:hypothetical protein R1flu_021296 [Riccia fluitans]|uniref:Uncharacterized protein n=1 Tax=Riccia fluitans TaxID=41844 RepID=A0ABD1ZNY6_9MARC
MEALHTRSRPLIGDPASQHHSAVSQWEYLKKMVKITHEKGGQLPAEDVNSLLLEFLSGLRHPDFSSMRGSDGKSSRSIDSRMKTSDDELEFQRLLLTAVGNLFSRAGNSVQKETWIAVVKMLRSMLESVVSARLTEDAASSRFYAAVLRCAHLVLSDSKGLVDEHIPGLVGAFRAFFTYGLSNSSLVNRGGQVTDR